MEVNYTAEQEKAIEAGIKALKERKPLFRIGGAAGTGKSTILKAILDAVPNIAPCAYTGKAASVLRKKGIQGTTIHKRIYRWSDDIQEFERLRKVDYDGFAIDEGSMVGKDIFYDLECYGVPILVIGDHYQLEPVSGKELNLMKDPDITLDQIHRQAEGNPIIELATKVRRGEAWGFQDSDPRCIVGKKAEFWNHLEWADVTICGFNKTRVAINNRVRYKRHYLGLLEEGEKVICLQNDMTLGVFNGLTFTIKKILSENSNHIKAEVITDDESERVLKIWVGNFGKEKTSDWKYTKKLSGKSMIADYAYAVTCHKVQGSEYEKVAVLDEQAPKLWNENRWRYTAITRASKELRLFK